MFDFTSAMRMLAFFVAAHFVASSDDTFGQKFPELCEQWNVMKNETCQCLSLQSDEVKNLVANCTSEVLKKENAKFVDVIEEACKHADDPFSHYLPFDTCMHPKMVSLMAENQSGPIAESSEAFQECLQRLLKKYNVIEAL